MVSHGGNKLSLVKDLCNTFRYGEISCCWYVLVEDLLRTLLFGNTNKTELLFKDKVGE